MPDITSVDLRGRVPDAGEVHFLRAEWKVPGSRFAIVRYSIDNVEPRLGLRLDLDKMAILDDVGDEATSNAVKATAKQIWEIVIGYRQARPETTGVMLTGDIMREMWPHGDTKIPGLVAGIVAAAPSVFPKYGLTSDLLVAHAMAQFSHECGAGTEVVENLNYSASGLMNTWPSRFDAAKAAQFAHDPEKIANEVYNGRMGNRPGTEDGWNYRGRGGSQVTGRNGYAELGEKVGLPLIDQPDLVNNPQHFLECAVADFIICNGLPFAQQDDVSGVTFHLNGGFIGLQERTEWLARWKAALTGGTTHGTVWVQQSLNKLGAEPPLKVDGSFGLATVAAVKAFQQAKGLDVDVDDKGKVGPQTVAAIEQALAAA